MEVLVQEEVLVSDADLRCPDRVERIGQPRQQLVEVDDHVRTTTDDTLADETHAAQVDGQTCHVVGNAESQTVALEGSRR